MGLGIIGIYDPSFSSSMEAYRIRVGDYRIVYEIADRVLIVTVIDVGHRREVYRGL